MHPKKSLGQNFLTSPHIVEEIVLASGTQKTDTVLEIGPGKGALTRVLLATGATVVATEKDDFLIPVLSQTFAKEIKTKQLTLVHGDILETDISQYITGSYKIVANIPYYITGQIIRLFLENKKQPSSMTLLVQKEVGDRIVARDNKQSILSFSIRAYGTPQYIRTVSKGSFFPSPKVDSAVIHIADISKKNFADISEADFFKLLHLAFGQKRKQLVSNLGPVCGREKIIAICDAMGLDVKIRAEDLSFEQCLLLFTKILEK